MKQGDTWLSTEVPKILASQAYADDGALFITWDEAETGDGPIGMMMLSPLGKGGGYANSIHYTHSSTLRTVEEIFGVSPLLGDAAQTTDLADLFVEFPLRAASTVALIGVRPAGLWRILERRRTNRREHRASWSGWRAAGWG